VHRSQLADDIATRFELRSPGLVAGRILEGGWDIPEDAQLVAATYQTLKATLESKHEWKRAMAEKLLKNAQGLIVDEVHTAPAETYLALLMRTRAYYRFGVSGTPLERNDAKSQYAIAAIGPLIYQIKPQLLIERGILAKPTVRMATVEQYGSAAAGWATVYKNLVVKSKRRNKKLIDYAKRCTKPGFLFVEQKEHGHALVKQLFAAGLKAEFVWGKHSIDYRKSLIKRLILGHFDLLVCSRVFNEGIDVPELRSVVIGSGGKSLIAVLQRLGRGMRVDRDRAGAVRDGGDVFEVYDILDQGQRWLEKHAKVRRDAYLADQYELLIEEPGLADQLRKQTA
jgi:superfamily II DNA or RNA helicase